MFRLSYVHTLCLASLVLACGCQNSDVKYQNLVPVSGKVTLDSKPVSGATVVFESKGGLTAFGKTDDSGIFELQMRGQGKGTVPETYLVKVEGESIPVAYHENGAKTVTVTSGENAPFAIDLKSRATTKDTGTANQTAQQ